MPGDEADLITVVTGAKYDVVVVQSVARVFQKLAADRRAALKRVMEIFAREGPKDLPPTQYRFEGRHPSGSPKVPEMAVYAFKAWQTRVYGSVVQLKKSTFIGTEIDDSKKQDKADPECLKRAARAAAAYVRR
jgi:hypothetical protein